MWARIWHGLGSLIGTHSHDPGDKVDRAMEATAEGRRALWISLGVLMATALAQALVVVITGSVALLSDTVHNFADALTSVPLLIAFAYAARAATDRFTYGYGRLEDLAGLLIVVLIAASAVGVAWTSINRLRNPQEVEFLGVLAAAGIIGFLGNELVARYRMRVGRRIGSAALVADGLHARTDGFTSLAVVASSIGLALGWQQADPIIGLLITVAILMVLRDAARQVFHRLLDAVDPALVEEARHALGHVDGLIEVRSLRIRWIGHQLFAEADICVEPGVTVEHGHDIAHEAQESLLAHLPRLTGATIHVSPHDAHGCDSAIE
jgi:cation diffusion facilitator family transporter